MHSPDPDTGVCVCPNCRLGAYLAQVYSRQQLASPDIMAEIPSRDFSGVAGGSPLGQFPTPPPPPPQYGAAAAAFGGGGTVSTVSSGSNTAAPKVCPMFECYSFCPYGSTCLLPHPSSGQAASSALGSAKSPFASRPQPPFALADAIHDLVRLGLEHENDYFRCYVCNFENIPESFTHKCGETAQYRYCPNCMTAAYQVQVINAVESLLVLVGDDAHKFKDLVDAVRAQLPEVLKIPFFYEAHRTATTVFGWSLVSPADAKMALETAWKQPHPVSRMPHGWYTTVISCGSGTGYIEHLFSRVANAHNRTINETHQREFNNMNAFIGGAFDVSTVKPIPNGGFCVSILSSDADVKMLRDSVSKAMSACNDILKNPSSFANVAADLPVLSSSGSTTPAATAAVAGSSHHIRFFAFDEIIRPAKFGVKVNYGSPQTFNSIDCEHAVLLLSWPPFGSPQQEQSSMGFEALRNYHQRGGNVLIYIGDVASTGDWRFHEFLATHWEAVRPYKVRRELRRWSPQLMGLIYAGNDTIGVYKRREVPLENLQWQWTSM